MNIIEPNVGYLKDLIKPFDEKIISELAKIALSCNKETESFNLRDDLYKSKYKAANLEEKQIQLENYLSTLREVKTKKQNKEYNWIIIDEKRMGPISSRFYIAPKPENIHEIVGKLTTVFLRNRIPIKFKYQQTTGMEHCDRIIIYSDYQNKKKVESIINDVYNSNKKLFDGCERSLAWLYDTSVPGVYYAPETPNKAYSTKIAETILEAKDTFNYLYDITNDNPRLKLDGQHAIEAYEYMKKLISSILLRNGLLLSRDDKCIVLKDKNLNSYYDLKTGILKRTTQDDFGFYEVKYNPTVDGKKALLNNFYNVSTIQHQKGLEKRYMTLEERKEEVDRILFPHKYKNK